MAKASVVLSTFNQANFIFESISSVAPYFDEVLVCDDASSDQTWGEVLRAQESFSNVRTFRNPTNLGVSVSYNNLINEAAGEWIFLQTGDDISKPSRRDVQLGILESTDSKICFTYPEIIDSQGRPLDPLFAPEFADVFQGQISRSKLFQRLAWEGNFLCAPSAAIHRTIFEKHGLFQPILQQLQDWEYWLRVSRHENVSIIKEPQIRYRKHGQNLSIVDNDTMRLKAGRLKFEIDFIIEQLSHEQKQNLFGLDPHLLHTKLRKRHGLPQERTSEQQYLQQSLKPDRAGLFSVKDMSQDELSVLARRVYTDYRQE